MQTRRSSRFLLIVAKYHDVDVKEVLRYELSTMPFALAHADGALRKTTKSVPIMAEVKWECQAQGRLPESAISTAFIFDAKALVHTLKSAGSGTSGDLAERYFNVLFAPFQIAESGAVWVNTTYWSGDGNWRWLWTSNRCNCCNVDIRIPLQSWDQTMKKPTQGWSFTRGTLLPLKRGLSLSPLIQILLY